MVKHYSINLIGRGAYPNAVYDGFSELWFDSRETLESAFSGPVGQAIEADISQFIGELVRVVVDEREILKG